MPYHSVMAAHGFRIFSSVRDYIFLIVGTAIAATAATVFYTPAHITGGGATGIGTIFYYVFGIDQGIVMMCINIPIVLFGMKVFGWRYGIRTLIGSIMLSLWTMLIGNLTDYKGFLDYSEPINILLSAIFGGCLMGIGVGLTMKSGSNTGGTDIVSQIVTHFFPVSIGTVSFSINAVVVSCGGIFFGFQAMLFAIIAMYISAQLTNYVMMGVETNLAKAVYILSDDRITAISQGVISELGRGGTLFRGNGIYTAKEHQMLLVIVPNNQLNRLLKIIKESDASAFVFITEAYEVIGKGFLSINRIARNSEN